MARPQISFVIPAYQAAKTLTMCIDSLAAQSARDWEAVIVDDGSTDRTFEIASQIAADDPRVRVIRQDNAGASAARNTAVAHATAPYITMLDADDWIDADFIEVMLPLAQKTPDTISYCSFQYAFDKQHLLDIHTAVDLSGDQARRVTSGVCPIAIHCAVLPRQAYLDVGGMDTSLATCEDWELWLKLAYKGLSFARVDRVLGYYRVHEGTLSGNPINLVRDGVQLIGRARGMIAGYFGEDSDEFRNEADREMRIAIWYAALFCRKGVDIGRIFSLVPGLLDMAGKEDEIGQIVVGGLLGGTPGSTRTSLVADRTAWEPGIETLLDTLQSASRPGLKRRLWMKIALKLEWELETYEPWQVGHVLVAAVDAGNFHAIAKPASADIALVTIFKGGKRCGTRDLPLFADLSIEDQKRLVLRTIHPRLWNWLGDSRIYRPLARTLFLKRRRLARTLRRNGVFSKPAFDLLNDMVAETPAPAIAGSNTTAMHAITAAARNLPPLGEGEFVAAAPAKSSGVQVDIGANTHNPEYWEALFETEDPWDYLSVYETRKYEQTLDILPHGQIGRALEIACAEGIFTRRLSERVDHLTATDISAKALTRAQERCKDRTNIDYRTLDLIRDEVPGGQDLIVCSEVLYYLKGEEQVAQVAQKFADALVPGGIFITAHAHLLVDDPKRTGFDWDNPLGIAKIRKVFSAVPGMVLEETLATELYEINRFRKLAAGDSAPTPVISQAEYGTPLTPNVAKYVVWGGAEMSRSAAWKTETAARVPVLMYHRVAADGPVALSPYRVTPEAFDQQMALLRRKGFYGVSGGWMAQRMRNGRPFKGRPILITFDDAYQDFADNALPILAKYDFVAEIFVVTDKVGGQSDWDAAYGEPSPLMDWQTIARMKTEGGMHIGSHLATHSPASSLTSDELLREAVRSKAELERRLGDTVSSIALPYGDYDGRVAPILREAGYDIAFSTRPDIAELDNPFLEVPRYNVGSEMSIEAFASLLEGR